ncbi:hypothetical protein CEXT_578251 [Caerostris extrusa]|uniref:Uncharacterized protein n=1 Tax=Caerostris extrusa TaxID=172846 RepID=A0AAV4UEF7_CAEEX|nr:hypothetical protein CEXT_578251 [Caerostris extrusa]
MRGKISGNDWTSQRSEIRYRVGEFPVCHWGRLTEFLDIKHVGATNKLGETPIPGFKEAGKSLAMIGAHSGRKSVMVLGISGLSLGRPTEFLDIKHGGAANNLVETPIPVFKEACTSTRGSADDGVGGGCCYTRTYKRCRLTVFSPSFFYSELGPGNIIQQR